MNALRSLLLLLAMAALLYVGVCALMFVQQRGLIYLGQYTRVDADQTDFALPREDGITLRGWIADPGQRDAVIYFGGNAEAVQWLHQAASELFPDHSVYLLPYRGYGASDGSPREHDMAADAVALFDHVRATHPDGAITVVGRSLGSGIAAHLARQRPVDRLVLVTPFDSMVATARQHYPWLPVRWLLRERYESDRHLAGFNAPALVIRAGRDQVIPPNRTDALIAALPSPPAVVDLPGADHNFALTEPAVAEPLRRFLRGD